METKAADGTYKSNAKLLESEINYLKKMKTTIEGRKGTEKAMDRNVVHLPRLDGLITLLESQRPAVIGKNSNSSTSNSSSNSSTSNSSSDPSPSPLNKSSASNSSSDSSPSPLNKSSTSKTAARTAVNRNARLRNKSVKQLKSIAKSSGMRGFSTRKRRSNLIRFMTEHPANLANTPSSNSSKPRPACEEECDEDGTCDGRTTATKDNDIREKLLFRYFKGHSVTDEELAASFACAPVHIRSLVTSLKETYPTFEATVEHIGGQDKNYDYMFRDSAGVEHKIELKSTKTVINKEELELVPWKNACQLIQVYVDVKDEKYKGLFNSFDIRGLWRSWFDTVIKPTFMVDYGITEPIDFPSYYRLATLKSEEKAKPYIQKVLADKRLFEKEGMTVGAIKLFQHFYGNRSKTDKTYRENLWHEFTSKWMSSHRFSDESVFKLVKETLGKKTSWINIGSNGAYLIQGPTCESASLREIKKEKKATKLLYDCKMVRPPFLSYSIAIKINLYWKNGGQGVHGLCIQLQPA